MRKISCVIVIIILISVVIAGTTVFLQFQGSSPEMAEEPEDIAPLPSPTAVSTIPTDSDSDGLPEDMGTGGNPPPTEAPPPPDFGSIAYDVPKRMIREEEVQVILLVSPSENDDLTGELTGELGEVGQEPGDVVTATIQIAKRMSATLTGAPDSAFEIVSLQASDEQFIYDDKPTQWEWTVVPKEGGTHRLLLRIERLVEMDGVVEHLKEEVYRDDVTVEVTFGMRVKDASAGLWDFKWLATVLLIPLFFYWLRRRGNFEDKND